MYFGPLSLQGADLFEVALVRPRLKQRHKVIVAAWIVLVNRAAWDLDRGLIDKGLYTMVSGGTLVQGQSYVTAHRGVKAAAKGPISLL